MKFLTMALLGLNLAYSLASADEPTAPLANKPQEGLAVETEKAFYSLPLAKCNDPSMVNLIKKVAFSAQEDAMAAAKREPCKEVSAEVVINKFRVHDSKGGILKLGTDDGIKTYRVDYENSCRSVYLKNFARTFHKNDETFLKRCSSELFKKTNPNSNSNVVEDSAAKKAESATAQSYKERSKIQEKIKSNQAQ